VTRPAQNMLQVKLEAIRVKFIDLLEDRLDELENLRDQIDIETQRQSVLRKIQFIAHKIAGTAGTLGYSEIGQLASRTEDTIIQHLSAKASCPELEDTKQVIDRFLDNAAGLCSSAYWHSA